ncbi:glycosyltransferase [Desulfovibrio ferrophilus]|uniref:Putative family 2 glycosyl transferase n=1 Tax=Desulfovibrio ferrophilus TaxID=241368 RepID=A0A2Z6B1B4_9BACT|nr:glycosyltransferase [Desulfovibrio ferrophilus]BBD09255.1 putative family 2 glycosyl transferase [Desulfovibrio ferrophilus]
MTAMDFAVILPAYNEAVHIGDAIDAVQACARGGISVEIVVVDNLSTDDTVAIARGRGVTVLENKTGKRMTISALRNAGARASTASLLAFLDADMLVPADWLEKAAARFATGFKGALGFAEQVPDDASWVGRIWGNRSDAPITELATDFLPGRNILVGRETFESIQGFDEDLTTCEDKDFTYRLNKVCRCVLRSPAATVIHLGYERSLMEFIKKEFWRQSTTLAFARRHNYSLRTLRNPLMSLWHLLCAVFFAVGIALGDWVWILSATALWLAPSALFTLRDAMSMGHRRDLPGVFALTFLRWNVSGAALMWQGALLVLKRGQSA